MSHVVTVKTQMKDQEVVALTCAALKWTVVSKTPLGMTIAHPYGYRYTVTPDGSISGDADFIAQFQKRYGVEAVKKSMRLARRPLVSETVLPNGEVKLVFAG